MEMVQASFDVVASKRRKGIVKTWQRRLVRTAMAKGRRESWGTHGAGWYKCNTCDGKGFIFTPDPPKPAREPKKREERPQRESRPQREPRPQREQRPQRTSDWLEKKCQTSGCSNMVQYKDNWEHKPNFCPSCKEKHQSSGGGYDRNKVLPGSSRSAADMGLDGATVKPSTNPRNPGGQHVTVWNGKGRDAERISWDVDSSGTYVVGSVHYTEGVMKDLLQKLFGSRW